MSDKTGISWSDSTWNMVYGCSRVSEGCRRCWAETLTSRFGKNPVFKGAYTNLTRKTKEGARWTGEVLLAPERLGIPLKWRETRRIFVCSMSDLFHPSVPDEFIAAVFGVMAACPQHIFQVLTKRPERAAKWFVEHSRVSRECESFIRKASRPHHALEVQLGMEWLGRKTLGLRHQENVSRSWPLPNVWIGTSIENQTTARERIPHLLRVPAAVRWLSVEPMLGPVRLRPWLYKSGRIVERVSAWGGEWGSEYPPLGWIVCGGESGPGYRPMDPAWARSLRDQCVAAGTAFFFKQSSGYRSETAPYIVEEDGSRTIWHQFPGQITPPERVEGGAP